MSPISLGSIRGFAITVPRWAPIAHTVVGGVLSGLYCAGQYEQAMKKRAFNKLSLNDRIVQLAPRLLFSSAIITGAMVGLGFVGSIGVDAFARLCGRINAPRTLQMIGTGVKNVAHVINPVISGIGVINLNNKMRQRV